MKTIAFLLNPIFFLSGFIPTIILSFFLLKKIIFKSAPKKSRRLIFKILQIVLIEFVVFVLTIIFATLFVVIWGLGGGLLAIIFLPYTLISCFIISVVAITILYLEKKNTKYQFRNKLTKTNLLITVLIVIILGLITSILISLFLNYK